MLLSYEKVAKAVNIALLLLAKHVEMHADPAAELLFSLSAHTMLPGSELQMPRGLKAVLERLGAVPATPRHQVPAITRSSTVRMPFNSRPV